MTDIEKAIAVLTAFRDKARRAGKMEEILAQAQANAIRVQAEIIGEF